MSLVGFAANNHPQQTDKRGALDHVDDRGTPPEVFDPLHARFRFTLDACALSHNAKLDRFFTPEQDGLSQSWREERVWCNPPFSNIRPWIEKAWKGDAELVVMLVPANRTEQGWWQDLVEPFRDAGRPLRVEFIRGRTRFIRHGRGQDSVGPNERPPFGCCLLIWERRLMRHPGATQAGKQ